MLIYSVLSSFLLMAVTAAIVAPMAHAAQIEGSTLKLLPGETKDRLQSNHFITVISRKNGSVQVFYRDPDDGHRMLQKEVATGCSTQITYWDFHRSSLTQIVKAPGEEVHTSAEVHASTAHASTPTASTATAHASNSKSPIWQSAHASKAEPAAHESTVKEPSNSSISKSSGDNYLSEVNTPYGPCVWKHFPIKVFLTSAPVSYFGRMQAEIHDGFDSWSKVSHDKIIFQFVDSPRDADIELGWTTSIRNLKNQSESGEANVDYRSTGSEEHTLKNPGDIYHARITFVVVDKNRMAWRPGDFRPVAIHEIGHALGLMGHSRSPRDIMYYMKNSVTKQSTRDTKTLNLLYESVRSF